MWCGQWIVLLPVEEPSRPLNFILISISNSPEVACLHSILEWNVVVQVQPSEVV